jgi:hypothetical protein
MSRATSLCTLLCWATSNWLWPLMEEVSETETLPAEAKHIQDERWLEIVDV